MVSKKLQSALTALFPNITATELNSYKMDNKHAELLFEYAGLESARDSLAGIIANLENYANTRPIHPQLAIANQYAWNAEFQRQIMLMDIAKRARTQAMSGLQAVQTNENAHIKVLNRFGVLQTEYNNLRNKLEKNRGNWLHPSLIERNEVMWNPAAGSVMYYVAIPSSNNNVLHYYNANNVSNNNNVLNNNNISNNNNNPNMK